MIKKDGRINGKKGVMWHIFLLPHGEIWCYHMAERWQQHYGIYITRGVILSMYKYFLSTSHHNCELISSDLLDSKG